MAVTQFDDLTQVGTVGSTGAAAAIAGTLGRVGAYVNRAVAASAALTNTTAETVIGTYSIPANSCAAGTTIKFYAQGIVTAAAGADTLTIRVRLNGVAGTIVCASAGVDVVANDVWIVHGYLTHRTVGTGGTFVGSGLAAIGTPATGAARPALIGSTATNTTSPRTLVVTGQWSAAATGDSTRLDMYVVEALW